jgi:hypothetical protein
MAQAAFKRKINRHQKIGLENKENSEILRSEHGFEW